MEGLSESSLAIAGYSILPCPNMVSPACHNATHTLSGSSSSSLQEVRLQSTECLIGSIKILITGAESGG